MTTTLRVCPTCSQPTLRDSMYSEDDASVFDQRCSACGTRHYYYVPSRHQLGATLDWTARWDEFERKYPKVEACK